MKLKDENKTILIFKATLQLVAQHGLAGISMASIAKTAGLGTGTLYTYFSSKEELVHALYKDTKKCTGVRLCCQSIVNQPVKLVFREIWVNYLRYRIDNYEEGLFQHQYMHSPYMNESAENMVLTQQMLQSVFDVMDRGKQEGIIKNVDNKLLFAQIVGFASELAESIHDGHIVEKSDFVDTVFSICWDAVKA